MSAFFVVFKLDTLLVSPCPSGRYACFGAPALLLNVASDTLRIEDGVKLDDFRVGLSNITFSAGKNDIYNIIVIGKKWFDKFQSTHTHALLCSSEGMNSRQQGERGLDLGEG